jgi:hypothetical protein
MGIRTRTTEERKTRKTKAKRIGIESTGRKRSQRL